MNITSDLFETLPSARGFQQLTTMAPGVTLEMGDHDSLAASIDSPTVGGSSAPENNYIIDGLSVTDPRYGTSGANLTMNFVQEVQVLTGGYQAEYGRSTGGVFNVITKSGRNAFHGDLFNYDRHESWMADDVERRENKELTTFADSRYRATTLAVRSAARLCGTRCGFLRQRVPSGRRPIWAASWKMARSSIRCSVSTTRTPTSTRGS